MSGEKTERPTDHRLRKAREEGNVAKSKDLTQTLLMGVLFAYTLGNSEDIVRNFTEMLAAPANLYGADFRSAVAMLGAQALKSLVMLLAPYLLIVVVVGILAETIQTGVLFTFQALIPKGDKLNPATNLKQMFSMKNLVEFLKSILKVIILSWLVAIVIRDSLDPLTKIPAAGLGAVGMALTDMLNTVVVYTFVTYSVISVFDFAYQRYNYIKGLMMSPDEIKQEYKQLEGDPHVKHHRRELAKEIAMGEMVEKTRDASVVVTNPTHLAIALYYVEGETPLPVVLGKGEGYVAEQIVRTAREEGIPVMQNIPLARALMSTAQIDQFIPSELIEPVAEVLLALRRLAEQRDEGLLP